MLAAGSRSALYHFGLALILFGVLMGRALAMPGWMPMVSQDKIVVALCSEAGGGKVEINFDREHSPKENKAANEQCVYAAGDHASPPLLDKATAKPIRIYARFDRIMPPVIAGVIASQAPPPPSTGPPLVS